MKKNNKLLILLALLAISLILWYTLQNKPQEKVSCEDCNIIIIGIDALRADKVGYYNYERELTPALDRLAKESYIFKNTIAQSSWTLPSFMSLFTSTYPSQHRITNKYYLNEEGKIENSSLRKLSPGMVTLAEVLKKKGYQTAGFTGGAGVGSKFGFAKGFDYYFDEKDFAGFNTTFSLTKDWITKNKEKKFFTFIHGYDCHGEFELEKSKRFFSKNSPSQYNGTMEEEIALREKGLEKGYLNLSGEGLTFWKNLYDDKILNMDKELSSFLKFLHEEGLMNKTILVIVSDHGEEFLEHGKIDHGSTLYDEVLKVVLMIKTPFSSKKIIGKQTRLIDIVPTIFDLLELEKSKRIEKQIQGASLLPLVRGGHLSLDAISETDYRLFVSKKSIRTPQGWKLIIDPLNGQVELYNLNNDPSEKNNLLKKEEEKYIKLKEKLFHYINKNKKAI